MLTRWITERLQWNIERVPAVALLGARQVGKTTLAKSLAAGMNSIYLDLESQEDQRKLRDPTDFLRSHGQRLVILDEIRRSPDLFAVLRGLIDQYRQQGRRAGHFLVLGSASMNHLRQTSESLAGRISYVDMSGLNVMEVGRAREDMNRLWLRGGFPESYLAENSETALNWQENLIRTVLERDVPQLAFAASAERLRNLWTMLAHLQGEPVNKNRLASNVEADRATVNRYIDLLMGLLLVRRLSPWHANLGKRLAKAPRYYIRDSGILHRLLGIGGFDELRSHPVLGKSWEGFVIENIHSVLPNLAETSYYRTSAGAEIDLVIKLSYRNVWAVEIKHGTAPKLGKHFSRICDDVGATKKFVVYGGDDEFPIGKDVTMISLPRLMDRLQSCRSE